MLLFLNTMNNGSKVLKKYKLLFYTHNLLLQICKYIYFITQQYLINIIFMYVYSLYLWHEICFLRCIEKRAQSDTSFHIFSLDVLCMWLVKQLPLLRRWLVRLVACVMFVTPLPEVAADEFFCTCDHDPQRDVKTGLKWATQSRFNGLNDFYVEIRSRRQLTVWCSRFTGRLWP